MGDTQAARTIREWLSAGTDEEPHTQHVLVSLLEKKIGRKVSQSSVSHIANGKQLPRADLVGAFRAVLGIEPEWWMPDAAPSGVSVDAGTGTEG